MVDSNQTFQFPHKLTVFRFPLTQNIDNAADPDRSSRLECAKPSPKKQNTLIFVSLDRHNFRLETVLSLRALDIHGWLYFTGIRFIKSVDATSGVY